MIKTIKDKYFNHIQKQFKNLIMSQYNTPSGKPPMDFIQCKSKADARNRAQEAGRGKSSIFLIFRYYINIK